MRSARLLRAAQHDHVADQLVESPSQLLLVVQLVGCKVAGGRAPRVRERKCERTPSLFVTPQIP